MNFIILLFDNDIYYTIEKLFVFVLGEVERLLREYRQNQELVRDIGAHNYQIIYPVQLRHHEKMGISTREAGSVKVKYKYLYKIHMYNLFIFFKEITWHQISVYKVMLLYMNMNKCNP